MTMGVRGELLLFILVLGSVSWICVNARSLSISDVSGADDARNEMDCTLCEQFTAQAIKFLGENETQAVIIDTLHRGCSRLRILKQECLSVVDHYAPLLFLEMTTMIPRDYCHKMNLCDRQFPNGCTMFRQASKKLEDPDQAQVAMVEVLLKVCHADEKYAKRCKKIVFAYAPLVMYETERLLGTRDLCSCNHNNEEDSSLNGTEEEALSTPKPNKSSSEDI